MYRLEIVEQIKLRATLSSPDAARNTVDPAVWKIGWTSLLTDISSEMVNSALPAFLVLYLHAGPLAFGFVDGLYHGVAVALLAIAGGALADRRRRYKEVAAAGYGLSALCKLAMVAGASSLGWLAAVVTLDRAGKGIRTAPRDALLSLHSRPDQLTMAFAVHRAMDAAGALIGPLVAIAILARMPNGYDVLWMASFAFALIGFAVLWLFVTNPPVGVRQPTPNFANLFWQPGLYRRLLIVAAALSVFTVSDGFLYLLLQQQNGAGPQFLPLYFSVTAASYMVSSVPVGILARHFGRRNVFLISHGVLLLVYGIVWTGWGGSQALPWLPLLLFGVYYAGSEGVLRAIASHLLAEDRRTSGLAFLNTVAGAGRMVGSIAFGWLWHAVDSQIALLGFAACLAAATVCAVALTRGWSDAAEA